MKKLYRLIPTLLLRQGGFVKTKQFESPNYLGDPINILRIFNAKEVNEITILDIEASQQNREPNFSLLERLSSECFMPAGYGGGVTDITHVEKILRLGFEKVVLGTSAFEKPALLTEAAKRFGSQSLVGCIDYRKGWLKGPEVRVRNAKASTKMGPVEYAKRLEGLGAGEVLLQNIDRDGMMSGYDTEMIKKVADAISIPLIACGGAASAKDMVEAIELHGASAAAAGSFFVYYGKMRAVLIQAPTESELEHESQRIHSPL